MPERVALTVGVTTRNRPQSLRRCLASLDLVGDALAEVIVVDDSSDVPVAGSLDLSPSPAEPGRIGDARRQLRRHPQAWPPQGPPGPSSARAAAPI